MKKLMKWGAPVAAFALLALVLVGCSSGGGGTPKEVKITVNMNPPATYSGTALDPIPQITLPYDTEIGDKLPGDPTADGAAVEGMTFLGWFLEAAGTTQVYPETKFTKNATIYAKWVVWTTGQFTLTFDLNYAVVPKTFNKVATTDAALGDDWPADPIRDDYIFAGWWTYENGNGNEITSTTVLPASVIDSKVWAKWTPINVVEEVPPAGMDLTGVEKVTIGNGFKVIYKFDMPVGKTFGDYKDLIAKYMVGPENYQKTGMPRTTRIHGNYLNGDFQLITITGSKLPGGTAAVAHFGSGSDGGQGTTSGNKNAPFIFGAIDTTNQSGTMTVASWLEGKGIAAEPWEWFSVTYPIDGTNRNGDCKPPQAVDAAYVGPLYFGIGFDTMSGDGGTHYIKDVFLEGATVATANLKGTPLYFKDGDNIYPAFCGYAITDGSNGAGTAYRAMLDGTTVTPVDVNLVITIDQNYTGAAAPTTKTIKIDTTLGADFPVADDRSATGYALVGWFDAATGGNPILSTTVLKKNTTLFAQWDNAIDITIDLNYTGAPAATTVTIGSGGTIPTADLAEPAARNGWIFDGWTLTDGTTVVDDTTTFTVATTIKAKWIAAVNVTINTGVAVPVVKKIVKGTALGTDFPANPTRTDGYYEFDGWNTSVDGKGFAVDDATTFIQDTTVYAIWKAANLAPADLVIFDGSTTPATANLAASWARDAALVFAIPFPIGYNATSYNGITIKVGYFKTDGTEVVPATSNANGVNQAQLKFASDGTTPVTGDGANVGGAIYNLGAAFTGVTGVGDRVDDRTPIPSGFNENYGNLANATHVYIQRSNPSGDFVYDYIEVYEITLHTALAGGGASITVDFDFLTDPLFNAITNATWNVSAGNKTITLPAGFDAYKWTVNGVQAAETGRTLTLLGKDYASKINTNITVTAMASNGMSYSKTIVIAVKR